MAVRTQLGLVGALLAAAAVGWGWTVGELRGMDEGPWTALGAFGWFAVVWLVMMAAMMLPSVAPTVVLYGRMRGSRSLFCSWVFAAGYLVTWSVIGIAAFGVSRLAGGVLDWDRAGRWISGAVLLAAALYELSPLKDVCLGKCRSPLGFLAGAWREGPVGALRMGTEHGVWCVGCCWALMASLFALGAMSVAWMAFVAGLIAFEKLVPYRRAATWGTAFVLLVLGVLMLAYPDVIPGLAIPT